MRAFSKKNGTQGFTLVELSIILLVFGIFAAGILSTQRVSTETKNVGAVTDEMNRIRNAIANYVEKNGYLPCPARRDLPPSDANFGAATNCSPVTVTSLSGIQDFTPPADATVSPNSPAGVAANDTIRIGMLPIKDLGLSEAYAFDPWNSRYTYVVVKKLAISSALYTAFTTTVTNGIIKVVDGTGTQIAPLSTSTSPAFVGYLFFSHGPDKIGAYNTAGVLVKACTSTEKDIENCDEDNTFVDTAINDTATGASYFYDILMWSSQGNSITVTP